MTLRTILFFARNLITPSPILPSSSISANRSDEARRLALRLAPRSPSPATRPMEADNKRRQNDKGYIRTKRSARQGQNAYPRNHPVRSASANPSGQASKAPQPTRVSNALRTLRGRRQGRDFEPSKRNPGTGTIVDVLPSHRVLRSPFEARSAHRRNPAHAISMHQSIDKPIGRREEIRELPRTNQGPDDKAPASGSARRRNRVSVGGLGSCLRASIAGEFHRLGAHPKRQRGLGQQQRDRGKSTLDKYSPFAVFAVYCVEGEAGFLPRRSRDGPGGI